MPDAWISIPRSRGKDNARGGTNLQNRGRFAQQEMGQGRIGNTRNANVTNRAEPNWGNDNHQEGEENDEYQGDWGAA